LTVADSPQGIFLFLSQLWNADKIWRGNFVVSDATSCSCLGVVSFFTWLRLCTKDKSPVGCTF